MPKVTEQQLNLAGIGRYNIPIHVKPDGTFYAVFDDDLTERLNAFGLADIRSMFRVRAKIDGYRMRLEQLIRETPDLPINEL